MTVMVWSRVKERRGGYHQEDDNDAGAGKEKRRLDNIQDDMKEYNVTEEMAENQSLVHVKIKTPAISTWRRHIGEKTKTPAGNSYVYY